MSSFSGRMKEYERISLDRFDGKNLQSTVYFLSHLHEDHTVGLATPLFLKHLKTSKNVFLYCSEVTEVLIKASKKYRHLVPYIKKIGINSPTTIEIPDPLFDEVETVTVTFLPAFHCPGSVMCLFEGNEGTVLYTGDFRWEHFHIEQMYHLRSGENVKKVKSLYVDTTFCTPENLYIPSRQHCIDATYQLVHEWISQSPQHAVYMSLRSQYGHEPLLNAVASRLNRKVHVESHKAEVYDQIHEFHGNFTNDGASTQIHACGKEVQDVDGERILCRHRHDPDKVLVILPTTMYFTQFQHLTLDKIVRKVGDSFYRVCYSFHSSYTELKDLISYLKPENVYPNVKPPTDATLAMVQQRLNAMLAECLSRHSAGDDGNEVEVKQLGTLKTRSSKRVVGKRKQSQPSDTESLDFGTPTKLQKFDIEPVRQTRGRGRKTTVESSQESEPDVTPGKGRGRGRQTRSSQNVVEDTAKRASTRLRSKQANEKEVPQHKTPVKRQRSTSPDVFMTPSKSELSERQSSYSGSHGDGSEIDLTLSQKSLDLESSLEIKGDHIDTWTGGSFLTAVSSHSTDDSDACVCLCEDIEQTDENFVDVSQIEIETEEDTELSLADVEEMDTYDKTDEIGSSKKMPTRKGRNSKGKVVSRANKTRNSAKDIEQNALVESSDKTAIAEATAKEKHSDNKGKSEKETENSCKSVAKCDSMTTQNNESLCQNKNEEGNKQEPDKPKVEIETENKDKTASNVKSKTKSPKQKPSKVTEKNEESVADETSEQNLSVKSNDKSLVSEITLIVKTSDNKGKYKKETENSDKSVTDTNSLTTENLESFSQNKDEVAIKQEPEKPQTEFVKEDKDTTESSVKQDKTKIIRQKPSKDTEKNEKSVTDETNKKNISVKSSGTSLKNEVTEIVKTSDNKGKREKETENIGKSIAETDIMTTVKQEPEKPTEYKKENKDKTKASVKQCKTKSPRQSPSAVTETNEKTSVTDEAIKTSKEIDLEKPEIKNVKQLPGISVEMSNDSQNKQAYDKQLGIKIEPTSEKENVAESVEAKLDADQKHSSALGSSTQTPSELVSETDKQTDEVEVTLVSNDKDTLSRKEKQSSADSLDTGTKHLSAAPLVKDTTKETGSKEVETRIKDEMMDDKEQSIPAGSEVELKNLDGAMEIEDGEDLCDEDISKAIADSMGCELDILEDRDAQANNNRTVVQPTQSKADRESDDVNCSDDSDIIEGTPPSERSLLDSKANVSIYTVKEEPKHQYYTRHWPFVCHETKQERRRRRKKRQKKRKSGIIFYDSDCEIVLKDELKVEIDLTIRKDYDENDFEYDMNKKRKQARQEKGLSPREPLITVFKTEKVDDHLYGGLKYHDVYKKEKLVKKLRYTRRRSFDLAEETPEDTEFITELEAALTEQKNVKSDTENKKAKQTTELQDQTTALDDEYKKFLAEVTDSEMPGDEKTVTNNIRRDSDNHSEDGKDAINLSNNADIVQRGAEKTIDDKADSENKNLIGKEKEACEKNEDLSGTKQSKSNIHYTETKDGKKLMRISLSAKRKSALMPRQSDLGNAIFIDLSKDEESDLIENKQGTKDKSEKLSPTQEKPLAKSTVSLESSKNPTSVKQSGSTEKEIHSVEKGNEQTITTSIFPDQVENTTVAITTEVKAKNQASHKSDSDSDGLTNKAAECSPVGKGHTGKEQRYQACDVTENENSTVEIMEGGSLLPVADSTRKKTDLSEGSNDIVYVGDDERETSSSSDSGEWLSCSKAIKHSEQRSKKSKLRRKGRQKVLAQPNSKAVNVEKEPVENVIDKYVKHFSSAEKIPGLNDNTFVDKNDSEANVKIDEIEQKKRERVKRKAFEVMFDTDDEGENKNKDESKKDDTQPRSPVDDDMYEEVISLSSDSEVEMNKNEKECMINMFPSARNISSIQQPNNEEISVDAITETGSHKNTPETLGIVKGRKRKKKKGKQSRFSDVSSSPTKAADASQVQCNTPQQNIPSESTYTIPMTGNVCPPPPGFAVPPLFFSRPPPVIIGTLPNLRVPPPILNMPPPNVPRMPNVAYPRLSVAVTSSLSSLVTSRLSSNTSVTASGVSPSSQTSKSGPGTDLSFLASLPGPDRSQSLLSSISLPSTVVGTLNKVLDVILKTKSSDQTSKETVSTPSHGTQSVTREGLNRSGNLQNFSQEKQEYDRQNLRQSSYGQELEGELRYRHNLSPRQQETERHRRMEPERPLSPYSRYERERAREYEWERARDYDRERARDYERERARDYERERTRDYNMGMARDYDRERARDYDWERRDYDRERARYYEWERARDYDRERTRDYERERARDYDWERARDYDRERARDFDREGAWGEYREIDDRRRQDFYARYYEDDDYYRQRRLSDPYHEIPLRRSYDHDHDGPRRPFGDYDDLPPPRDNNAPRRLSRGSYIPPSTASVNTPGDNMPTSASSKQNINIKQQNIQPNKLKAPIVLTRGKRVNTATQQIIEKAQHAHSTFTAPEKTETGGSDGAKPAFCTGLNPQSLQMTGLTYRQKTNWKSSHE